MRRLTCGTLVQTVQLARASGDQAKCCHISKLIQQATPTEHKVTQFLSSLNRARSGLVAKVERAARPARAAALETCIAPRGANRSHGIGTPPARGRLVGFARPAGLRSPSYGGGCLVSTCRCREAVRGMDRGRAPRRRTGRRVRAGSQIRSNSQPRSTSVDGTLPRAGSPGWGRFFGPGIREDLVAFWFGSQ